MPTSISISSKWDQHPLLVGRSFFTLPAALLKAVVAEVGEDRFDTDLLALERYVSGLCGDHSSQIGFWDRTPIRYDLLADRPSVATAFAQLTEKDREMLGWEPPFGKNLAAIRAADSRLAWVRRISRGYCGWLATNKTFERELARFFRAWQFQLRYFGPDEPRLSKTPGMLASIATSQADLQAYATARFAFLQRWHLIGLAGAFLPDPVRTMIPLLPSTSFPASQSLGTTVFLASIFPLPDRRELREMLEDSLDRNQPPSHLRGWIELVRSENPAKKEIARLGRIHLVQHFWRVLFIRHASAFKGRVGKVKQALATYVFAGVSQGTRDAKVGSIQKDLDLLAKVRGSGWYLKPSAADGV